MNTWIENNFDDTFLGDLRLFYCGKREQSISHQYGPYEHNDYQLVYIAEGVADFQIADQIQRVEKNTFYVMYPRSGMSYRTDPEHPWTIYWIIAGGKQLGTFLDMLGLSPAAPFLSVSDPERLINIYKVLFEKTSCDDLTSKTECLSLFYGLFSVLAEKHTLNSRNIHISKAMGYISKHYTENISVHDLAGVLHLNYNYFSRLFKQETGVAPVQFISAMRVKKAKELLKYTSLSVSEIAHAVGFQDVLYFSRAFKRCVGMSPSAYKDMVEI